MTGWRPDTGDRVARAEAIVTAALNAFEAQDWQRLVGLTDAGSLAALKTSYIQHKSSLVDPSLLFEDAALESGEIHEALKEWAMNRHAFGELAGITSLEQVQALELPEFLTRWAQARHPHHLVDGVAPWNPSDSLERRVVIGSVALLPDTVAVMVRATDVYAINTLGSCSLIAVLGDNAGSWALDASSAWLGLADYYM